MGAVFSIRMDCKNRYFRPWFLKNSTRSFGFWFFFQSSLRHNRSPVFYDFEFRCLSITSITLWLLGSCVFDHCSAEIAIGLAFLRNVCKDRHVVSWLVLAIFWIAIWKLDVKAHIKGSSCIYVVFRHSSSQITKLHGYIIGFLSC